MHIRDIKPGVRFRDPAARRPEHERIFEVVSVEIYRGFKAKNIATGTVEDYTIDNDVVERLYEIRPYPIWQMNLDCLVGDRFRVKLRDGGSFTSKCTRILYESCVLDGATYKHVVGIEFDHSALTTYTPHQILTMTKVARS